MTPIRETIARAIYLCDAPAASCDDLADAVLRALDESGLVVVPRDPSEAMRIAGLTAICDVIAEALPVTADLPAYQRMARWGAVARSSHETDAVYRAMIAASVVE